MLSGHFYLCYNGFTKCQPTSPRTSYFQTPQLAACNCFSMLPRREGARHNQNLSEKQRQHALPHLSRHWRHYLLASKATTERKGLLKLQSVFFHKSFRNRALALFLTKSFFFMYHVLHVSLKNAVLTVRFSVLLVQLYPAQPLLGLIQMCMGITAILTMAAAAMPNTTVYLSLDLL